MVALEINAAERGNVTIETIGAGDVLGWSWVFPPYTWHFSARALEPVHAIAIEAAALRAQCEADHDFGYELMRRFAAVFLERLQATRLRLLDIYGPPVRAVEMRRGRA
jgi:CRP-like cAMP-binding protein